MTKRRRTKSRLWLLAIGVLLAGGLGWLLAPVTNSAPKTTATLTEGLPKLRTFRPFRINGTCTPSPAEKASESLPTHLPLELRDGSGRVRRLVKSSIADAEAVRRQLLEAGGTRVTWLPGEGFSVSLEPHEAQALERAGLTLAAARVPSSEALREEAESLLPDEVLRATLICADEASCQATEALAARHGMVEVVADTTVIARLSRAGLASIFRESGAGILAADLRREGALFAEEAPAPRPPTHPNLPFFGRGERISLPDTGCSAGLEAADSAHLDLAAAVLAELPQPWWALAQDAPANSGADRVGHGTAIAGILVGGGEASPRRSLRGTSPEAKLLVQNLAFGDEALQLIAPPDLRTLFEEAHARGASILSNSWGSRHGGNAPYSLEAWASDSFAWEHPEAVLLFAAGNSGPEAQTLAGGAALGKNVLTVGALNTAGERPADFSSRGPTADSRTKPELWAPGKGIIGPRTGSTADYVVMSGTSLATPMVAAGAALVRQALREQWGVPNPSAALVRALLVLGSQPFASPVIGGGRLDLEETLLPTAADLRYEAFTYGASGSHERFPIELSEAGELSAVLAWVDAPADIAARDPKVNALVLRLEDAQGIPLEAAVEALGTQVRLTAPELPAGAYQLVVESVCVPIPGGAAALAVRLPASQQTALLHAPIQRAEPGTSHPLVWRAEGPEADAVQLWVSSDGETWELAPQSTRLDVPSNAQALWYSLETSSHRAGPFAVQVGQAVVLTVANQAGGLANEPNTGEHLRVIGEVVEATASPTWTWQIRRAPYPIIKRRWQAPKGWRLTDQHSGRTLAQGKSDHARFAMPDAPAVLTWY